MKAQIKTRQHQTILPGKILVRNKHDYSSEMQLFKIAGQMKKENLPDVFIVGAVKTALEYEGVSDLLTLWSEENNGDEKKEIISDIQDMIDACNQKQASEELSIKFNDLDAIANNIRAFKDSLYQKIMTQGGISKLADLTGIPQPSLSRFFNSNAMPRRATVLKIAKALNLDEIKIDTLWCR